MIPPDIKQGFGDFFLTLLHSLPKQEDGTASPLRLDLSDVEYADWFLGNKIVNGRLDPAHALNDFVIFRIVHDWPSGAVNWTLDAKDVLNADFMLNEQQAIDLVDMAREGLSDGYTPATWFAKLSIAWFALKQERMPDALFVYLQQELFLPPPLARKVAVGGNKGSGRRKADGVDRDRVIRNLIDGLRLRNPFHPSRESHISNIVNLALSRRGVNMTADSLRHLYSRSKRTEREMRLWKALLPST